MRDETYSRIVTLIAGLMGAAGVAMAAAAAHVGETRFFGPAAAMCLVHAPALLALDARRPRPPLMTLASALLGGGTILFSGDLAMRALENRSAFALAAPTGGTLMILGWVAIALAALVPSRR
ncbi:MAG: DUF423 domain-containing protein [Pararhizobium sp.]